MIDERIPIDPKRETISVAPRHAVLSTIPTRLRLSVEIMSSEPVGLTPDEILFGLIVEDIWDAPSGSKPSDQADSKRACSFHMDGIADTATE